MSDIFIDIFNLQLCMSAVILIFMSLRPYLKKNYQPKICYWLWLVIILRLCLPFDINLDFMDAKTITIPVKNKVVYSYNPPEVQPDNHVEDITINKTDKVNIDNKINETISTNEDIKENTQVSAVNFNISAIDILVCIWLSVAVLKFIYTTGSYLKVKRNILLQLENDENLDRILESVKEKLGIADDIRISKGDYVGTPMLVGIISPLIIVPDADYNETQLEMIIRHELNHFRRKDVWFKFLLNFVTCFYWFNPLFAYMEKFIDEDIEISCDYDTVKHSNKDFKVEYAQTIMRVIAMKNNKLIFSTSFSQTAEIIKTRLKNILSVKKLKKGKMVVASFAMAAVFSTSFVACSVNESTNSTTTNESRLVYTNGSPSAEAMQRCEDDFYFPMPVFSEQDMEVYAGKIDSKGKLSVLCNKEGCEHNDESCNAYTGKESGDGFINYFTVNNKPYAFSFNENTTDIFSLSENGKQKILSVDYNGDAITSAVVNGNKIYIAVSPYMQLSKLISIDLETNEVKEICTFEDSIKYVEAKSVINDSKDVIVTAETEDSDYVCSVNTDKGEYNKLKQFKFEDIHQFSFEAANKEYEIYGDKLYVIDRQNNKITVETVDKNDTKVLVGDITTMIGEGFVEIYSGFDGKVIISRRSDIGTHGFNIDSNSGNIKEIKLETEQDGFLSIVEVYGNNMIVYSIKNSDLDVIELSYMSVEDYLNNIDNKTLVYVIDESV